MNKSLNIKKRIAYFLLSFMPLFVLLGLEVVTVIPLGTMENWILTFGGIQIQLYNLMSLICYASGIILCGIWYGRLRKKEVLLEKKSNVVRPFMNQMPQTIVPLKKRSFWLVLLSMVLAAVGLQFVTRLIVVGVTTFFPILSWVYQLLSEGGASSLTLLYLINTVILAPLVEETAFRGITLHYARKVMPFWLANIWQALLFGVCHTSFVKGAYAFVMGAVLGYFYRKSHSIRYTIIIHMLVNLIATFASDAIVTCYDRYFVLSAAFGIALTMSAMWLFSKELQGKAESEKPSENLSENEKPESKENEK